MRGSDKRSGELFGAGLRKIKLRRQARIDWAFTVAAAAYALIRASRLIGAAS